MRDVLSHINTMFIESNIDKTVLETELHWLDVLCAADRYHACTKGHLRILLNVYSVLRM